MDQEIQSDFYRKDDTNSSADLFRHSCTLNLSDCSNSLIQTQLTSTNSHCDSGCDSCWGFFWNCVVLGFCSCWGSSWHCVVLGFYSCSCFSWNREVLGFYSGSCFSWHHAVLGFYSSSGFSWTREVLGFCLHVLGFCSHVLGEMVRGIWILMEICKMSRNNSI